MESINKNIIKANGLHVVYRQGFRTLIRALDGVDFTVEEGDIFGLLGPNGAGKSTAMYCFLGLIQPDKGEVNVLGERPNPGAGFFEDVAYLPEEPHYHPYLSVQEAVNYYANLYRRRITFREVDDAIEKVGLGDFKRLRISKCSKGMKQKVGIAACMLFEPRVLFLDEPTRGLDPIMVRQFRDHLLAINRKGTTVILNSHILSEVELVCTRVAIMNKGKVLADDILKNLIHVKSDEYEVFTDETESLPEYVMEVRQMPGSTVGVLKETDLERFIHHCLTMGLKLQTCRVRMETLEDVFLRIIKGSADGQDPQS